MLTEFSIGNYQAFSTPQRVPLKPITLIFGPNSAGKSAMLRSLLLSKDAILHGTLTKTDVSHEQHPGRPIEFLRKSSSPLQIKFTVDGKAADGSSQQHQIALEWSQQSNPGIQTDSMMVVEQGKEVAAYRYDKRTDLLHLQFVTPDLVTSEQAESVKTDREILKRGLMDRALLAPHGAIPGSKSTDFTSGEYESEPNFDAWLDELLAAKDKPTLTSFGEQIDGFRSAIHKRLVSILADLSAEFEGMAYHEPLRPVPKQITEESRNDPALSEWWKLASEPELLRRVNDWFASSPHTKRHRLMFDRLLPVSDYKSLVAQLGGELTPDDALEAAFEAELLTDQLCEEFVYANGLWDDDPDEGPFYSQEEAMGVAHDTLASEARVRGWEHFNDLVAAEDISRALAFVLSGVNALRKTYASRIESPWKHFKQADIYFEDVATGAKISPSNLGVGFSQMVPFVSSALSSENRLIAIEQPELHVHPALQTELADLFINSAKERGNRFLIETHSEHLILRLLRRVRETNDGPLEPGRLPLYPEDLCVLYVQPGDQGSEVIELPVTPDGDFSRPWPNGFFAERSAELF